MVLAHISNGQVWYDDESLRCSLFLCHPVWRSENGIIAYTQSPSSSYSVLLLTSQSSPVFLSRPKCALLYTNLTPARSRCVNGSLRYRIRADCWFIRRVRVGCRKQTKEPDSWVRVGCRKQTKKQDYLSFLPACVVLDSIPMQPKRRRELRRKRCTFQTCLLFVTGCKRFLKKRWK